MWGAPLRGRRGGSEGHRCGVPGGSGGASPSAVTRSPPRNLGKSGLRVSCLGLGESGGSAGVPGGLWGDCPSPTDRSTPAGTWVTFGSQISDEVSPARGGGECWGVSCAGRPFMVPLSPDG